MPPPREQDDDTTPKRPRIPSTPRRASDGKRTPNGTPTRKIPAAKPRTPASAPMQTKSGSKKPEPTLFSDFLLGRPSPNRTRRRSLEVVKAEMRKDVVKKLQSPGGVKDRVKQWQKAGAAAAVEDPTAPVSEPDEMMEQVEESSVDERDRIRIKMGRTRRGQPKAKEPEYEPAAKGKIKSAPRKRLISDDHWVTKESPPKMMEAHGTGSSAKLEDLLKKSSPNPPLERSIDDWVKRTANEANVQESTEDKPRTRKTSRCEPPDDGIPIHPSRTNSFDDGIRITPLKDSSSLEDIRIKPTRKVIQREGDNDNEIRTPRKRSEKQVKPSADVERKFRDKYRDEDNKLDEREKNPAMTPSPLERSRRQRRRSESPPASMVEVPFGSSAFSVLDLPVGAEAGTMRRPKPQRTPSLSAVPKVLRKVYNEGKRIVHDTVDPHHSTLNHPPSIESWLNGTTDPFMDRPAIPEAPEWSSRRQSYKGNDLIEEDLYTDVGERRTGSGRDRHAGMSNERDRSEQAVFGDDATPPGGAGAKDREVDSDLENSTPTRLRRSHATRNASSPIKSGRKLAFKDAFTDAFRGESTTYGPKVFSIPLVGASNTRQTMDCQSPPDYKTPFEDRNVVREDKPPSPPGLKYPKQDAVSFDVPSRGQENLHPSLGRRQAPTTGEHRLSTIASVETLSTLSSTTKSTSELSHTTVTQNSSHTGPAAASSLSHRSRTTKPGLKRRLTKHSDLISVLSLPDSAVLGRAKSIKSARSVRTARAPLETATIEDLLRELADDETKYMRELKTLVGGVIPVLLTCVLSKSSSAIAAGLCQPGQSTTATFTKPIIEMGVALERLKSLHKRIPLDDTDALTPWLHSANKIYSDYTAAWKMGFKDIVVNLAPASRNAPTADSSLIDGMPLNEDGDVINANGERVDVAFLLKRPLARVKYLSKLSKGLQKLNPSAQAAAILTMYEDLEAKIRRRVKEESARLVDISANDTDPTRARDPETLAPIEGVQIDRTLQVCAKDFFSLDMSHSSGQRMECLVELILRDKPSGDANSGDVLFCKIDNTSRCLLFPPISKSCISARIGDNISQIIVMIRGNQGEQQWRETLILDIADQEDAKEWVKLLGMEPIPPPAVRKTIDPRSQLSTVLSSVSLITSKSILDLSKTSPDDSDIPIGERRRRQAEAQPSSSTTINKQQRRPDFDQSSAKNEINESYQGSLPNTSGQRDLNEAMNSAGKQLPLSGPTRARAARYHSRIDGATSKTVRRESARDQNGNSSGERQSSNSDASKRTLIGMPVAPEHGQANQGIASDSLELSTPLEESMRPHPDIMKKRRNPTRSIVNSNPIGSDGAPSPPAHRTLTTPTTLKNRHPLPSPTPKPKKRRSSSPLKHEYQPSNASGTSSSSELSDSADYSSVSDSTDDEELEATDLPSALPGLGFYGKRVSPPGSLYSFPNTSLAPSNSASQAPYRGVPVKQNPENAKKICATISSWSDKKGRWEDLYEEPCSIVVTPGLIEAFEMSASHSSPNRREAILQSSGTSDFDSDGDAGAERPLIALELTPLVSLRQSTALDIEIRSPPTARSRLTCSGTVRYRAVTYQACQELYQAIHRARLENPVYKKLEQERVLNSYGGQSYEAAVAGNRRRSWFGRKKSYRATTRAPSATVSDQSSNSHQVSAFSALKRMSGGSMFNIEKSSMDSAQVQSRNSSGLGGLDTSSSEAGTSGRTPPLSSTGQSFAGTTSSKFVNLGSENLKIRLYLLETSSKWNDIGAARLTVTQPPAGMRQASSLYHGIEKRIVVRRKPIEDESSINPPIDNEVLLDVVLGGGCFSKIGRTGVVVNIWEEVTGPNGEIGKVGSVGGLSGRTRKWLFQCGSASEANWIYGLVAMGR